VQLNLNAVNAVDTVKEQNQNEDKRYLDMSMPFFGDIRAVLTFIPYCILATIGLSAKKVKSLRFQVKGIGTMRAMKMTISRTRRQNT